HHHGGEQPRRSGCAEDPGEGEAVRHSRRGGRYGRSAASPGAASTSALAPAASPASRIAPELPARAPYGAGDPSSAARGNSSSPGRTAPLANDAAGSTRSST